MELDYQQSLAGLESPDPEIVLNSAIWMVENPECVQDQNFYMRACELLQTASCENLECLQYINERLSRQVGFKAQLLSSLMRDTPDDIKSVAKAELDRLIENTSAIKNSDTDLVSQIYSAIRESGDPALVEKAKSLLE